MKLFFCETKNLFTKTMAKANSNKAVLVFVVILSISIVHSAKPDVRHDKIRRTERRSRLEEQVRPQILPAKIPTDLLTNRSTGSANPVRHVPSHPKARLNHSITGTRTPNNHVHNAIIAPSQKETREAPQKVENNIISSEPKLPDVRAPSLKVSANNRAAVKGGIPQGAGIGNTYDNITSSGLVKEGNEKPDQEKVDAKAPVLEVDGIAKDSVIEEDGIAKDPVIEEDGIAKAPAIEEDGIPKAPVLEESQMSEMNSNPETDVELNALTSNVAVPIDALKEDEVEESLEISPNAEMENNSNEMLASDDNEISTYLNNLSSSTTDKPTTKQSRQKQMKKPNVSQTPKKSAAPVNKKLISPLAVSSRLPSKAKTESKTENAAATTLENNTNKIVDKKDDENEMSSEEKFSAEENESEKKSVTDALLSEDDKSDAGAPALDSKTGVDSVSSDDNSNLDQFSSTGKVVTERISLHAKPINPEAIRKGGVPQQSPTKPVTQNTDLKLPNSGHPKLKNEHSSHPKQRARPSTLSPRAIENKPNSSTPSLTEGLSPPHEKHNTHADEKEKEISDDDSVTNKDISGLETGNNSKNKTFKPSQNKSDSNVDNKSSKNTVKDKTAPKIHEDSTVNHVKDITVPKIHEDSAANPVKVPLDKSVDNSIENTAQDTSLQHKKTEVKNSKNTHPKKESSHHKAPNTKHRVASLAVVMVSMFLLAFVTFLTILGVYFNKISFSRRSHWHHMALSTEEDDLPLFNRETHYDDYDPPYESWKQLT